MPAVPFGGEKKGERERCVKGLPERDAQEFLKNILFQVFKIGCAPLTRRESSPKLRTPKGSAEKLRKRYILLGFCMGIYGFYQGKVRAEFLAKEFSA